MSPGPGQRLQRFVGDLVRFSLKDRDGRGVVNGWRALLRTNLGRAEVLRREIIQAHTRGLPPAGQSWRDLPMRAGNDGWSLDIALAEVGYFKAKAYLVDPGGWQHWPSGEDVGISVHPNQYRTANTIYCAFTRQFGATRSLSTTQDEKQTKLIAPLDKQGYTIIPPSGKLRDLIGVLPHIRDTLGCRILHLLPVHPTPTTYARFGRFGSPYAALDLTAIDPALAVFDKRTTGVDQFQELTYACHLRGMRVFLDIVINHTGWGSVLQATHPEWFVRNADGQFVSPGAWGTIWEDLVELKHVNVNLWDELAQMFLIWCRRGVDGFRCDAGYKVPVAAWQYIIARVQQEFPETIFLLEGLGGAWEITEALLTEGGMQWAYSELFQNYSAQQVAGYLDHNYRQNARVGLLVHYSETHDNPRLAARGRAWSLLRNRLCALASVSGGFGFTGGVEWLAAEKVLVHGASGLSWGSKDNLIPELSRLNAIVSDHPCFFEGASVSRLSDVNSSVYVLHRVSAEAKDQVLVLVNTDVEKPQTVEFVFKSGTNSDVSKWVDLLGQAAPSMRGLGENKWRAALPGAGAYCLAPTAQPQGLAGDLYRQARGRAAFALGALGEVIAAERLGELEWRQLAASVDESPARFLAAVACLARLEGKASSGGPITGEQLRQRMAEVAEGKAFPEVLRWAVVDARRITLVPPNHWILVEDTCCFRAELELANGQVKHAESILADENHIACFAPSPVPGDAKLRLDRFTQKDPRLEGTLRYLPSLPVVSLKFGALLEQQAVASSRAKNNSRSSCQPSPLPTDMVLLTNGRGGMARLCVDLGRINSKYDCLLGANLHPTFPVDRHILAKRLRVWVNADGFIAPLDFRCLDAFTPGPPAVWDFIANAGDGRTVQIQVRAAMLEGRNTTVLWFSRPPAEQARGKQLPEEADVRLTVRVDIEDRGFHGETKRNGGAEHHFNSHTHALPSGAGRAGFSFTPASDRFLRVCADAGQYHPQPEWSDNIPHPVEQSRGQVGGGDAFSPGWFDLPLPKGARLTLVAVADSTDPGAAELEAVEQRTVEPSAPGFDPNDTCARQLLQAVRAFVVKRDSGKTVIAGYPWFLDWGRDTFICARGLLAAGMHEEVRQILLTFARFEKDGTLPNTIFGADASNRDTSDAPLWFGVVCEELAGIVGPELYSTRTGQGERTLADTLWSIADNYRKGTPNGIRMDPASGLIWSPSHFTWMDTNYPAGTPREGYPVEIQSLWVRLLRQLERLGGPQAGALDCRELAQRALASLESRYWLEREGWYSDVLTARRGQAAAEAVADDALRSNCLFLFSLGLVSGDRAKRCVNAAVRYLVVPGALRSLAPLPVSHPLPIRGNQGQLLNDPSHPYWGRYEGDEDTRRKPAYHNGTAWTWTFPVFCEALARAWDFAPGPLAAAKAYLASMTPLLHEGCLGHLPEIVDGDAPHTQRGCDAQAWGATEALRVWRLLHQPLT